MRTHYLKQFTPALIRCLAMVVSASGTIDACSTSPAAQCHHTKIRNVSPDVPRLAGAKFWGGHCPRGHSFTPKQEAELGSLFADQDSWT